MRGSTTRVSNSHASFRVNAEAWVTITRTTKVLLWMRSSSASHGKFRGRGSGVEVDFPPYAWLMTLRAGKIVQATMYMDKQEALAAAGLRE